MSALAGKVAVITGASRGIGQSIAEVFVREGASVVICSRKQESVDEVAKEIGAANSAYAARVLPLACHVGKQEDIDRLVKTVHDHFGQIDVLVNNAATNIAQGPCLSFDDVQFDKMVDVNLKSVYRLMRAIAPGMCERGWGSVVNIASIAGLKPQFESLLYSMTKAALIMMTQSYALELGSKGVRVNAIAPGLIQTKLSEFFWKDEGKLGKHLARQPIKHIGQPVDIAELALLLASDRGSYITGQTFVADGGFLMGSM